MLKSFVFLFALYMYHLLSCAASYSFEEYHPLQLKMLLKITIYSPRSTVNTPRLWFNTNTIGTSMTCFEKGRGFRL